MKFFKRLTILLALISCGVSLTACGSQGQKSARENSSLKKQNQRLKKDLKKPKKKKQASSISQTNQGSSASSTQPSSANSTNGNGDPKLADGTDVYSLPLSDPRNPDSYKQGELMDIAGDPKYRNPDGSMNAQGEALTSSIEASFHQPQQ